MNDERLRNCVIRLCQFLGISLLVVFNELVPAFALALYCLTSLARFRQAKYAFFALLIFSVAVSKNDLVTVPAFFLAYLVEFTSLEIEYVIALASLLLFKHNLGYIVIPLAIAFYALKYDSRIFVGTAIVLLVASAYTLSTGNEKLANDVAIYAYYFLVLGVIGSLIEYLRESKSEQNSVCKVGEQESLERF